MLKPFLAEKCDCGAILTSPSKMCGGVERTRFYLVGDRRKNFKLQLPFTQLVFNSLFTVTKVPGSERLGALDYFDREPAEVVEAHQQHLAHVAKLPVQDKYEPLSLVPPGVRRSILRFHEQVLPCNHAECAANSHLSTNVEQCAKFTNISLNIPALLKKSRVYNIKHRRLLTPEGLPMCVLGSF